jgi:hypothetical protein
VAKPSFPFGDAQPFSTTMITPWLGGNVVPVAARALTVNFAVAHGLRRIPRFCWVLDVGKNSSGAVSSPLPRGATAWDYANAYFNWPQTTDTVLLVFG